MTSVDPRNDVGAATAAPPGEAGRGRAFSLLAVACFMTAVDMLVVNVALPTIGVKLHFAEADLQWVVTAYALAFGGFLLPGRAGDVLRRLARLRAGHQQHVPDHHARRAGPRRRRGAAGRAVDRHEYVPR